MTTNLEVPTQSAYALKPEWLEVKAHGTNNASIATSFSGNLSGTVTNFWTGWPNNTYWYYPVPDHRPIKLGLSEVEKLRSAAKRDAKLKKILEKFTDQIEVVVDFK